MHGTDANGNPVTSVPAAVLDSIRKNRVCLKGTLYTPLSKTTATESLNVQMRKQLDSHVNLVHGFTLKGLPKGVIRHDNVDIVVIRYAPNESVGYCTESADEVAVLHHCHMSLQIIM